MSQTYLTTEELAQRIKYDARTIRNQLKDSALLGGVHYIRPSDDRKTLCVWEKIEADMFKSDASAKTGPCQMRDFPGESTQIRGRP